MALIVTSGAATANSYISLADAATRISAAHAASSVAWTALTDTQKEFRLSIGVKIIDSLNLHGYKACAEQALMFPRFWYSDFNRPKYIDQYPTIASIPVKAAGIDNIYGSPPTIQTNIKNAQVAFAVDIAHTYLLATSIAELDLKAIKFGNSFDIPYFPVTTAQTNAYTAAQTAFKTIILTYLKQWVKTPIGLI